MFIIRALFKIFVLIILGFIVIVSSPTIPTQTGDRYQTSIGFEKNSSSEGMYIGASSNTNTFDINKVGLNLYYGFYNEEKLFVKPATVTQNNYDLYFVLYVYDSTKYEYIKWTYDYTQNKNYYFMKDLTEEEVFKDNEYSYSINMLGGIKYNHNEWLGLPSGVFIKQDGYLDIAIVCFYYNHNDYKYYSIDQEILKLYYEKTEDSKIILNFNEKI